MPVRLRWTAGLLFLGAVLLPARAFPQVPQQPAAVPASHDETPVARAVRTDLTISIDARLDDAAWRDAEPVTGFIQTDPDEGAPASRRTEVRILYTDDALYIGANLHDHQPVSTRLGRRDSFLSDSDWFAVALDSYHDHLTAYRFTVNPSGVRGDQILSGPSAMGGGGGGGGRGFGDDSWDPVWQAATAVTDSGWVAEIRIPFSQLRFSRAEVLTWGIQLERRISSNQEQVVFAFTPRTQRGGVPRYGHLEGLEGLRSSSKRLEVLPYFLGRANYRDVPFNTTANFPNPYLDGSDFFSGYGADLKYRLTSNLTLDATVNPDFGQVEVDPAVINLTAFETRFQENRPFFIEGSEIFRLSGSGGGMGGGGGGDGAQILYTRRIGRSPQIGLPSDAAYGDIPETAMILGAGKLTGKIGDWSVGLMEAVTGRERAPYVDLGGLERRSVVEPLTNYFAGRIRRDVNQGNSGYGALVTAVHRQLDDALVDRLRSNAYAGALDLRHNWGNRVYSLSASVSGSYVEGSSPVMIATQRASARYFQRPDAEHVQVDSSATSLAGATFRADISKRAGTWQGNLTVSGTTPSYEVNDLGFQNTADRFTVDPNVSYDQQRPGRYFRRYSVRVSPQMSWNFDGTPIDRRTGFGAGGQLANYWNVNLNFNRDFGSFDDRLTRGGPLARSPAGFGYFGFFSTDGRNPYTFRSNFNGGWDEAGGERMSVGVGVGMKPGASWDIQIGPNWSRNRSATQYVTTITDALATETYGRRYVFADLEQTTVSLDTRLNLTFSPALTLELFAQPFLSSGDYGAIKQLAAPRTLRFDGYGTDRGTLVPSGTVGFFTIDPDGPGPAPSFEIRDRDFNFRSLRGNAVLRWEWRPGSALFLVWQQNRSETVDVASGQSGVGQFDFGRDARELFQRRADNVFILKVNYWWNP